MRRKPEPFCFESMWTVVGSIQVEQGPQKGRQEEMCRSVPPEMVDLVNRSNLDSICRCEILILDLKDEDTH